MSALTNEAFLEEIFGAKWKDALIAAFPGDPEVVPQWQAYRANWLPPAEQQERLNTYFCPSLTRGSARQLNQFVSFHVIVIDDFGTKVLASQTEPLLGPPGYLIETSAGNFHAGWPLSQPLTDLKEVRGILSGLRDRLGAGDNLTDPMAWRRLPVGINGKAKYLDDAGRPWVVRGRVAA